MFGICVSTRDPSVAKLLRQVRFDGLTAEIEAKEGEYTLGHTFWDSGCRHSYYVVGMETGNARPLAHTNPPQFGGPHTRTFHMEPNVALVEVYYNGKRYSCRILVTKENLAPLLPAPTELTRNERIVLAATRGLKSSYNGCSDYRFRESKEICGITREEYDAAKAELIGKKLLNKAGAITVDGRNAIGHVNLYQLRKET